MREDMYKVIVERPRRGGGWALQKDGRKFRNSEDAPQKVGMKRGYQSRKSLNENLSPLKRFLESSIGKPWNKVYSELSEGIDRRNTVQEHIYSHIEQFVAIHTKWDQTGVNKPNNGDCVRLIERIWFGGENTLKHCNFEMYVHPKTGLLLGNPYYKRWSVRNREKRQQDAICASQVRQVISANIEHHLIDSIWYEIEFALFPSPQESGPILVWDVLKKDLVSGSAPHRYAKRKRQLSSKQAQHLPKAQPFTGLFLWPNSAKLNQTFTHRLNLKRHSHQQLPPVRKRQSRLCDGH
jgi:hypothetical protein